MNSFTFGIQQAIQAHKLLYHHKRLIIYALLVLAGAAIFSQIIRVIELQLAPTNYAFFELLYKISRYISISFFAVALAYHTYALVSNGQPSIITTIGKSLRKLFPILLYAIISVLLFNPVPTVHYISYLLFNVGIDLRNDYYVTLLIIAIVIALVWLFVSYYVEQAIALESDFFLLPLRQSIRTIIRTFLPLIVGFFFIVLTFVLGMFMLAVLLRLAMLLVDGTWTDQLKLFFVFLGMVYLFSIITIFNTLLYVSANEEV